MSCGCEAAVLNCDSELTRVARNAFGNFLYPAMATRLLALMDSDSEKAHLKLRHSLYRLRFRPETVHPWRGSYADEARAVLRHLRISESCWVISEDESLEGTVSDLDTVVSKLDGTGWAAFAMFGQGRFALHLSDYSKESVLLVKPED